MRYRSNDGLMTSSDPNAVVTWNSIGKRMEDEQREATAALRAMGVKAEHPDDGWVNRELNRVQFSYAVFNDGVKVDDLIALGWPWKGYRIVRVTRIENKHGIFLDYAYYYFEEHSRWPEPKHEPKKKWRRRK